ncbi:MAG: methyltransferase domain-containing protein [Polyangiaceae bacterium]|nr:methyltransferase domain-containing protein [Polyangiaceae bacterium]
MTAGTASLAELQAELCFIAAERTGVRLDALRVDGIREVATSLLAKAGDAEAAFAAVHAADPELMARLEGACVVSETYFYRQPDHFDFIAETVAAMDPSKARVRAWSAGCATGEEAWSLAATLRAATVRELDVLGTDVRRASIDAARRGSYKRRGLRYDGQRASPFEPGTGELIHVREDLRNVTRFEVHNLLEPPPGLDFDVILCRNVLLYFTPEAQTRALSTLKDALAPGGIVLFSPMDLPGAPEGLERVGRSELQAFRRPMPRPSVLPSAPPPRPAARVETERPPPRPRPSPSVADDAVAMHLAALAHLDRGERREAEALLASLCATRPSYIPGLVENALLLTRNGERRQAAQLMREVLERTDGLDPHAVLPGPEPMTVAFYTGSARAFLERHGVTS